MDDIIYTYGGGEVLWKVFNGLAILFKNDSAYWTNIMPLALVIGGAILLVDRLLSSCSEDGSWQAEVFL